MGVNRESNLMLSADEFMARHEHELAESEEAIDVRLLSSLFPEGRIPLAWLVTPSPSRDKWLQAKHAVPGYQLMRELKQYWLVRLLKAAINEDSPDAYRELLEGWLIRLGVEPPAGLFKQPRRPRGAPQKESTERIYCIWLQNERPQWSELAFTVFGAEYTRADSRERKKLRDRCQRAVRRYESRRATKNH